jgi:hypothetical protein
MSEKRSFAVRCVNLTVLGLVMLGLMALFAVVGIAGWEYSNSNAFCGHACHSVHPEEPAAHRASQHSEVTCVECHLGRRSVFESMFLKVGHTKHLWSLLTGYERPLESPSMPASRDSCEGCHSPQPHTHDSVRMRDYYAPDAANTHTRIGVILRTAGAPVRRESQGIGIHWHTDNRIDFIAGDGQRTRIPWLQVTLTDGSTKTYTDRDASLAAEEIAAADKVSMDCIDCHNRVGHPFHDPEEIVDEALALDELSTALPFVKQRMVQMLRQQVTDKAQAHEAVEAAWQQYLADYPELQQEHPDSFARAKEYAEGQQALAVELLLNTGFSDPDLDWRSFPDHSGHRYSAGCFRCHDGKHVDEEGTPVRANCTLCHSVPVVIREGTVPQHFLATLVTPKPAYHNDPGFVVSHRTRVDDSCEGCHGEIRYGTDDRTFCANSGCHGQVWPGLDLAGG